MASYQFSIDFHHLFTLFSNVLPLFDRHQQCLTTRFRVAQNDISMAINKGAIQPAQLCVMDGQGLLRNRPMLYGKWRRNGLAGAAELIEGLNELLLPSQRRDDAALVMLADVKPQLGNSGYFFQLYRVHHDRLNCDAKTVEKVNQFMRKRTQYLVNHLRESDAELSAIDSLRLAI